MMPKEFRSEPPAMRCRAIFGLLALCVVPLVAPAAEEAPGVDRGLAVIAKVEQAANALARKDQAPNNTAKYRQDLRDSIDLESFAQITLETYWMAASAGERQEFIEVLQTMLVNEIVRRAARRKAGSLEVVSNRLLQNGDLLLSTRRAVSDDAHSIVDWRLRRGRSTLRIVDVVVEGWSVASSSRQDFIGQLNRNGGSVAMLTSALRDRMLRPF